MAAAQRSIQGALAGQEQESALSDTSSSAGEEKTAQVQQELVHTFAIDIFAFGMIYASCIVGLHPSREKMVSAVRKAFGPKIKPAADWERDLILSCICLNPLERPSIGDVLAIFDSVM
jgi:serine/threonine protein kinase